MNCLSRLAAALGLLCLFVVPAAVAQHEHPAGDPQRLGKVEFATSCAPAVKEQFNRAVALLHSFWFERAAQEFAAVAEKDPACAMAHWGIAMTYYHPLWEPPGPADLQKAAAAVAKAKELGAKTDRERDYIGAIEVFYKDFDKQDHRTRALAYEKAMEQLAARHTEDREAAIFYALAMLANAPPTDKTYARQKKAGAIVEQLFAAQPEHPGLAHYIIHSYDSPPLAQRALAAARRYAKIAPDSPHALHMPSHIFTRLGLWEESIHSNQDSAAAARKHGAIGDELHAMDYLAYAYLQRSQDREAEKLMKQMPTVGGPGSSYFAGLYARAAIPARFALERHHWEEAAKLTVPPSTFPSGAQSWTEANLRFAKGLGAARSGNPAAAREEIERLASLRQTLEENKILLWAGQVEIHRQTVAAWLAWAEGKGDEALKIMRAAADAEDASDKHPVTPSVVLPARELLADMLMEAGRPGEAIREYETALAAAPNRFNSLYGAGRAAQLLCEPPKAIEYYQKLTKLCEAADTDRRDLVEASAYLGRKYHRCNSGP